MFPVARALGALVLTLLVATACTGELGDGSASASGAPITTGAGGAGTTGGHGGAGASTVGTSGTGGTSATTGGPTTTSASAGGSGGGASTGGNGGGPVYPVDAICAHWPDPADAHDQSVVPVEVPPNDPASAKIVLIAGAPSLEHPPGAHEFFAGSALLAKLLCQTPGVTPVLVKNGWPSDPAIFAGAKAVVLYLDGRDHHPLADPARLAALRPALDAGAGFVNLHYAVDYEPAVGAEIRPYLGGTYEVGYSVNPIWQAHYGSLPSHPIANGLVPFTVNDEWYYDMRWVDGAAGVTPILSDVPPDATRTTPDTQAHPGRSETTAWAFDRPDGGRGFGLTGGHWHGNWTDGPDAPDAAKLRRVVVNGILWAAHVPVPAGGAPVDLDPADGGRWLDTK